jgi:acyl-homoserine lactone acylase PvdQ
LEIKLKLSLYWLGNSSDPKSKHFNDQSEISKGQFKDVLFYKEDEKQRTKVPSWRINTRR